MYEGTGHQLVIIIIIYFYYHVNLLCVVVAYEHIKGNFTFNDDWQSAVGSPLSYLRHITFAWTGCYQLHNHHRLGIITPVYHQYQFSDPKRMNSLVWLSWGRLYARKLCLRLFHVWFQKQKEINPGFRSQDQLNREENEPRLSDPSQYQWTNCAIHKGPRINLWKCWVIEESNHRPCSLAASGLTLSYWGPECCNVM